LYFLVFLFLWQEQQQLILVQLISDFSPNEEVSDFILFMIIYKKFYHSVFLLFGKSSNVWKKQYLY